jgi:type IV pilus assembly protein PilQ
MDGRCRVAVAGMMAPAWAQSQNMIRSVTASQQANGEVVRVELSQPWPAQPSGFVIQAPPRVAVDLPQVGNGLGVGSVEINQGNVRSVSVASTGERTRLVLNLKQTATYQTHVQGNILTIALDAVPLRAAGSSQPVHFANSQNADQLAIRDIDFRRGPMVRGA